MNTTLQRIYDIGVVPVIAISDTAKAVPLAQALIAGGIPCVEITFRTAEGEESLRLITKQNPDILAGAGTILTTEQVDRAQAAGAQYIVSPGFNPKVVAHCLDKGIPIIPGCVTPSEMEIALEMGITTIKFFPAEQAGGLAYLKAISAPYTTLRFLPTGGIDATNLSKYIAFDRVIACGGSWMATKELINTGNFARITQLSQEAMKVVREGRSTI
jgi:2-dehydro-3-deoxyphosphogluconate aldolase/(4S)-4-hydroxy-2-oxoglutarate aldolase